MAPAQHRRRAKSMEPALIPRTLTEPARSRVSRLTSTPARFGLRAPDPSPVTRAKQLHDMIRLSTGFSQCDDIRTETHQHELQQSAPLHHDSPKIQSSSSVSTDCEAAEVLIEPGIKDFRAVIHYHVEGHRRLFQLNELYGKDHDTIENYTQNSKLLLKVINSIKREMFSLISQQRGDILDEADEIMKHIKKIVSMDDGPQVCVYFQEHFGPIDSRYRKNDDDILKEIREKEVTINTLLGVLRKHDDDYNEVVSRFRRRATLNIMGMLGDIGIDGLAAQDNDTVRRLEGIVTAIHSNAVGSRSADVIEAGETPT